VIQITRIHGPFRRRFAEFRSLSCGGVHPALLGKKEFSLRETQATVSNAADHEIGWRILGLADPADGDLGRGLMPTLHRRVATRVASDLGWGDRAICGAKGNQPQKKHFPVHF
jgi:hypothetical protein